MSAGKCNLKAELDAVRGVMFLATPAAWGWAETVAHRLNTGVLLLDRQHSGAELAHLQGELDARLADQGLFRDRDEDTWCVGTHCVHNEACIQLQVVVESSYATEACALVGLFEIAIISIVQHGSVACRIVQVQQRRSSAQATGMLGQALPAASSRRRGIAAIAHLDLVYSVAWPVNIVITKDHLLRYRKLLPVFLQV